MKARIVFATSVLALGACATTGYQTQEARSVIDQAAARCTASIIGGAVLGALTGNNTGNGSAARGAMIGAAGGGVVCAVIMVAARDKAAVIEAQRAAAASGVGGRQEIVTKQGQRLVLNNAVQDDHLAGSAGADPAGECKTVNTTLEMEGSPPSQLGSQRFCKNAEGVFEIA